jgi:hypothetical protein
MPARCAASPAARERRAIMAVGWAH